MKLDLSHYMFEDGSETGYFLEGEGGENCPRGSACSGSGGDRWYLVNDRLYDWLLKRLDALKSKETTKKKSTKKNTKKIVRKKKKKIIRKKKKKIIRKKKKITKKIIRKKKKITKKKKSKNKR